MILLSLMYYFFAWKLNKKINFANDTIMIFRMSYYLYIFRQKMNGSIRVLVFSSS